MSTLASIRTDVRGRGLLKSAERLYAEEKQNNEMPFLSCVVVVINA